MCPPFQPAFRFPDTKRLVRESAQQHNPRFIKDCQYRYSSRRILVPQLAPIRQAPRRSFLHRGRASAVEGALMGLTLSLLYGFLYLLLRLEDYALLAGSVGLFAMLALLMYATRRVNWYDLRLGGKSQS